MNSDGSGSGSFTVVERDTNLIEMNRPDDVEPEFVSSETETDQSNDYALPYMAAAMFATIIEDAIQSLCILGECNNALRVKKAMANIKILMANKYGIKPTVLKDGIYHPVTSMEKKLRKLMTDKQLLLDVLKELYRDLCLNGGFQWFAQYLAQSRIEKRHLPILEEEEARNKAKFKEFRKQLRMQRIAQKSAMYEFAGNVDKLRAHIEDTEQIGIYQTVYHIKWQRSRRQQYAQSIIDVQNESAKSINFYKDRLLEENRVHNELEHWNSVIINERLMEIEKMMHKYDRDNEAMDLKIRQHKVELNNMIETREAKERLMVEHEEAMEAWMKFKDDRAAVKLHKMIMQQSALIVQAWWRGLLVRQQLGPYRPKKVKETKGKTSTAKPEDQPDGDEKKA